MSTARWKYWVDLVKHRQVAMRIGDRLGRSRGRLRFAEVPARRAAYVPDVRGWEDHSLSAAWLGHATVLLRVGGVTILTDPVFSNRVGIGGGPFTVGPRRLVAPALGIKELPKIDVILISHAHFDHLDRPTLHRLPRGVKVITAHRTQDLIRDLGFKDVTELRWGESAEVEGVKLTARKVVHWGARTFYDTYRGYNAYEIQGGGRHVLYGGDSAYQEFHKEIGSPVDLAILGIGAYDPYIAAHASPEQAVEMAGHCRAERILAMHHSTFRLSYEPVGEPLERMRVAAGERLVASEVGQIWTGD